MPCASPQARPADAPSPGDVDRTVAGAAPGDLADRGRDPGAAPAGEAADLTWVPVKTLEPAHRAVILQHLLGLSEDDRYLRFGHAPSDEQIRRYVQGMDFARDEVFGVFDRQLRLGALAHLAFPRPGACPVAEYGVSVAPRWRGQGFGTRLFAHAMLLARNRGTAVLLVHALAENQPMLRIARAAGASVQRHGPDAEARIRLPQADLASRWEVWVESAAGSLDYRIKQQVRHFAPNRAPDPGAG
jgi:GNAT superfamily N-acetyltransferase